MMIRVFCIALLTFALLPLGTLEAQDSDLAAASRLESLINQDRVVNGRTALTIDPRLEASAQAEVDFMVSHGCLTPPCAGEPDRNQRATAAGYPTGGLIFELADARDTTPEQVMVRWSNPDDGTQFILLYPTVTDLGCARGSYREYTIFVCDFGQNLTSSATPIPTSTPIPPTATAIPTATPVPPTATAVPTSTPRPSTATPGAAIGECGRFWEGPEGEATKLYEDRMTRLQCVGF